MSFVGSNILAGASGQGGGGYEIERSLRFNSADSAYLNRTPSSAGNRKTWTWSAWVKKARVGEEGNLFTVGASSTDAKFRFNANDTLEVSDGGGGQLTTAAVFRDTSAWYHIVVLLDNTQATEANRFKLYINGSEAVVTGSPSSQNTDGDFNTAVAHYIGRQVHNTANLFNGYLADVHFIDGQALAPTDFGKFDGNGVWQPKEFAGTYGWFNQSQTWSSLWTGTANYGSFAAVHNGVISTANYMQSYSGATFTLPSALPVTSLRLYCQVYGAGGTVLVNGVDVTSQLQSSGIAQANITGVSSLSTINITGTDGNNLIGLYAIELNGKYLIDSGITGIADNSFHLPFSDNSSNAALGTDTSGVSPANTWTVNNLTHLTRTVSAAGTTSGSPYSASFPWSTAFDGSITSVGAVSNAGGANSYVHTFTTPIPCTTAAFVIYTSYTSALEAGNRCAMNGVALTATASANWTKTTNTLPVGSGSVGDYFVYTVNLGGTPLSSVGVGNTMRIAAVLIDGVPIPSSGSGSDTDSLRDTPTNGTQVDTGVGGEVVGNYATLNPLKVSGQTLKNGNLVCSGTSGNVTGTIYVSTGKYYWEFTAGSSYTMSGIESSLNSDMSYPGATSEQYALYGNAGSGLIYHSGSTSSFDGFVSGDVIGVALDMNEGKLYFYKNGSVMNSGNPAATGLLGKAWTCNCRSGSGAYDGDTIFNFGQRPFAYTAPSGYKSLNTANLPTPTIADGSTVMDVALWSGTGSSQTISLGFNPDLIWTKTRSNAVDHKIVDVVRGFSEVLESNQTRAEVTDSNGVTGSTATGFTVGSSNDFNSSGRTFVGWSWDAGDATTTIAAGGLNSSLYDQSQTWSSGTQSGNAPYGSSSWNNVFNGVIPSTFDQSNLVYQVASGGVFTFSSAISGRIQVYAALGSSGYLSGNTIVLSDGSSQEVTNGNSNFVLYDFGTKSNITSITLNGAGSSSGLGVPGILLDGKLLVDAGVSITTPSIASTIRANPSAGFSIVKWTGVTWNGSNPQTIGHGLAEPEMIILKNIDRAVNWAVYHKSIGNTTMLQLNTTDGQQANDAGYWNNTTPTSSVFTVGNGYGYRTGGINEDFVAYCFAPVEGYSAIGSYTGNGSTDGPFIYTGFRPAFLLIKNSSLAGSNWIIIDTARDTFNEADHLLKSNVSDVEQITTANEVDILSNGFKPRGTDGDTNGNGNTLVYAAFAENPFKTARAR